MNKLIWLLCCIAFTANAQKNSLRELINRKQFEEVLSQTKLLTSSDSTHAETMYSIGEAYEGLLKYKDAFRTYKICYALDSLNTDFLYAMARTATNLGKVSEAKSSYGKILAMDSTNFYASYQLARLHYQLDELKDAMQIYSRLLDKDPDNSALWRSMGDCYTRTRQNEIAALSYFKAYSLNRENGSLANTLINSLLRLGGKDAADALAICDTALFYNPGNIQLRQSKGMALYTNKQYAAADSVYTALMAEGDSSYTTVSYTGVSRYNAGLFLASIEPLELAYQMDTTSAEICLLLGSSLGKTYDRERAFVFFDKAEKAMQPSELIVNQLLLFRADIHMKARNFEESSRLYYQAYQRNKKQIDYLAQIAFMYSAKNNESYRTEEEKQRGLFIHYYYASEMLKNGPNTGQLRYLTNLLQSFHQELFFKGIKELPMLAPDGKRSMLSADDLQAVIKALEIKNKESKSDNNKNEAL